MEMRNNGKTKHVENIYIRFITHLKNISTSRQTAKKKTMGYITPAMGYYPRNG